MDKKMARKCEKKFKMQKKVTTLTTLKNLTFQTDFNICSYYIYYIYYTPPIIIHYKLIKYNM